jgi:hypothetical protein
MTMFRFRRSLALRLPQPLQPFLVVVLLSLSFSRERSPSCSLSSSSHPKERRSQTVKLFRGGQHTISTAAWYRSTHTGSPHHRPGGKDNPRRSIPFLHRPLGGLAARFAPRTTPARSRDVRPPLLLCPLRPRRWRSDSPHPRPIRGERRDPQGAEFHLASFEGGLKLVPDPIGHLGSAPTVVVVAAIIIIFIVDGNLASISSSHVGRPITHGPADVVVDRAAAAELFDFRSVPPPCGQRRGHRQEWSLLPPPPPSWRQGPTTTTTKTVASLSRRRGRRREEDDKLRSSRLSHKTAEGPPACHGRTWWATAAGLLVARG